MQGRLLVGDDHAAARESVIDVLRLAGYAVDGAASATEALAVLERRGVDVIITDLQMPGIDGLEFIRRLVARRLPTQVIMVTAHATIASAVEAMRLGAFDYLEKPFDAGQLRNWSRGRWTGGGCASRMMRATSAWSATARPCRRCGIGFAKWRRRMKRC
jgi:DNA-binding NtrC family response regulator